MKPRGKESRRKKEVRKAEAILRSLPSSSLPHFAPHRPLVTTQAASVEACTVFLIRVKRTLSFLPDFMPPVWAIPTLPLLLPGLDLPPRPLYRGTLFRHSLLRYVLASSDKCNPLGLKRKVPKFCRGFNRWHPIRTLGKEDAEPPKRPVLLLPKGS